MVTQFHSNLPNVQQEVCIEPSKFQDGQIPQTITVTYQNGFPYNYNFYRLDENGNYCYVLIQIARRFGRKNKKVVPPTPPCPTITFDPDGVGLPNGEIGVPYGPVIITVSGGTSPYTFTTNAPAPLGYTYTTTPPDKFQITGLPVQNGSYHIILTATDANGCMGIHTYGWDVGPPD